VNVWLPVLNVSEMSTTASTWSVLSRPGSDVPTEPLQEISIRREDLVYISFVYILVFLGQTLKMYPLSEMLCKNGPCKLTSGSCNFLLDMKPTAICQYVK
jgi:hypothetical protein